MAAGLLHGPASALPLPSQSLAHQSEASNLPLILAGGCHREVERHFVPEFGRRAWHYHRGSSCRPIEVDAPAPPAPADCHRDVQRHYVPEYGQRLTHRHVGPSCRIQIYEEIAPGRPPSGVCVSIGGVTFCLNE